MTPQVQDPIADVRALFGSADALADVRSLFGETAPAPERLAVMHQPQQPGVLGMRPESATNQTPASRGLQAGERINPKTGQVMHAPPEIGQMPVLDAPLIGVPQMARGAVGLVTAQDSTAALNGASDLMEGLGKVATPAAVAAALVDLPVVAGTLAASWLASWAAGKAADLADASPEAKRFAENLAATVTAAGGARAVYGRLRTGVGKVADVTRVAGDRAVEARAALTVISPEPTDIAVAPPTTRMLPERAPVAAPRTPVTLDWLTSARKVFTGPTAVMEEPANIFAGVAQRPSTAPAVPEAAQPIPAAVVPAEAALVAPAAVPEPSTPSADTITVYHGSPHSFDKFDLSKIGTGEGAQAFGHGLYFADSPEVARNYQPGPEVKFSRPLDKAEDNAAFMLARTLKDKGTVESARESLQKQIDILRRDYPGGVSEAITQRQGAIALLDSGTASIGNPSGAVYHVTLPKSAVENMLDWDKPLSEQPEAVKQVAKTLGFTGFVHGSPEVRYDPPGQVIYAAIGKKGYKPGDNGGDSNFRSLDPARPANYLKAAGIPGIKYLDGGSRGKGDGTRNYVVFDDTLPQIASIEDARRIFAEPDAPVSVIPAGPEGAVVYHGSTRPLQGQPRTGMSNLAIKGVSAGEAGFNAFFVSDTPEGALLYAGLKSENVQEGRLSPDTKVLDLSGDIISEEVLGSPSALARSSLSTLKAPTQPFPFQSEFLNFAFDRLNLARGANGKEPFTREQFGAKVADEFDPSAKTWNTSGLSVPYLEEFVRAQGYDAIKFGRETAVLNPDMVSFASGRNASTPADPLAEARAVFAEPPVDVIGAGLQPRLPGDVGAVRDLNIQTPEFDAPFSLSRPIAPSTSATDSLLGSGVPPSDLTTAPSAPTLSGETDYAISPPSPDTGLPPSARPGEAGDAPAGGPDASGEGSRAPVVPPAAARHAAAQAAIDQAVTAGYEGPPVLLRRKAGRFWADARFDAKSYLIEQASIQRESSDLAFLKAIAKAGGIGRDADSALRGEWANLWESSEPSQSSTRRNPRARRAGTVFVNVASRPTGRVWGVPGVFRTVGGKSFDTIRESLEQDGQWGELTDLNELIDRLDTITHRTPDTPIAVTPQAIDRTALEFFLARLDDPEWWLDDSFDVAPKETK